MIPVPKVMATEPVMEPFASILEIATAEQEVEPPVPITGVGATDEEMEPPVPVTKIVATQQEVGLPVVSGVGPTDEEIEPSALIMNSFLWGWTCPLRRIFGSLWLNPRLWFRGECRSYCQRVIVARECDC